jgi:hypothetical protein
MTTVKLNGAMPADCIPDGVAGSMWRNLGGRYMALVELHVAQRTQPAHGETGEPVAQLRVTALELARSNDDDETLRQALQARYKVRTTVGTLDSVLSYGELRDALAVLHHQLEEDKELKGFPVAVDWDGDDLLIRVSPKPAEETAA